MSTPIIDPKKLLLITDIPGYTYDISRLICMMNISRHTTLQSVEGLTVKELDFQFDEKSNSIGALLYHFSATEY